MSRPHGPVVVTRAADDAREWCERLRSRGFEAIELPCLRVEFVHDDETAAGLSEGLEHASWVAFSSRRAVLATAGLVSEIPSEVRIGCVGPATEKAAQESFGRVDAVAGRPNASGLAATLVERIDASGARRAVLFPAGDRARPELPDALARSGVRSIQVTVYRTVPVETAEHPVEAGLLEDATVVVASPSALEGLMNVTPVPPRARILTTGPTTSRAVRERGLSVWRESREPSFDGVVAELE